MFRDFRTETHHLKILFVAPHGTELESLVLSVTDALEPARTRSRSAADVRVLGASSHAASSGSRTALADLELVSLSLPEDVVARVRAESLGHEVVRRSERADGYAIAVHLYWLPSELVSGAVQVGRLALDWLRGADTVVLIGGDTEVTRWFADHEPSTPIMTERADAARLVAIAEDVIDRACKPANAASSEKR